MSLNALTNQSLKHIFYTTDYLMYCNIMVLNYFISFHFTTNNSTPKQEKRQAGSRSSISSRSYGTA